MTISLGDFVRSFDFPRHRDLDGPRSSYIEGRVVDFKDYEGCKRYVIEVSRQVVGGKEIDARPRKVYPPVNGTRRLMGGVCDGVELIQE